MTKTELEAELAAAQAKIAELETKVTAHEGSPDEKGAALIAVQAQAEAHRQASVVAAEKLEAAEKELKALKAAAAAAAESQAAENAAGAATATVENPPAELFDAALGDLTPAVVDFYLLHEDAEGLRARYVTRFGRLSDAQKEAYAAKTGGRPE